MKYIPRYDIRLIRDGRISVNATPIVRTPQDTLPVLEPELSELAYENSLLWRFRRKIMLSPSCLSAVAA